MRLPWVSRAAFDLSQHNNAQLHLLVKEHADARYDNLLSKYHALRLQGANVPEPKPAVIAKEPSMLDMAITEKAGGNHRLRLHLTRWAAEQRQARVDDGEIMERVTTWSTDTDD